MSTGARYNAGAAVIVAIATLILASGIVVGLRFIGVTDSSGVLATLLLAPALAYALVSGRLTEIAAPGGWKLKLSAGKQINESQWIKPVRLTVDQIIDLPSKEDEDAWPSALRRQPTVLEARLDRPELLCEGLSTVTTAFGWGAIRHLVLVDSTGGFHSMVPLRSVSTNEQLIDSDGKCNAHELASWALSDSQSLDTLQGFVRRKKAVNGGWSRKECLRRMLQLKADALPVLEEGQLVGIIERSALVTSIIADLPADTSED